MNIYITQSNEEQLRKVESMSGLINRLLEDYFSKNQVGKNTGAPEATMSTDYVEIKDDAELAELTFGRKEVKRCKHGSAIGLCKFGCKYVQD